ESPTDPPAGVKVPSVPTRPPYQAFGRSTTGSGCCGKLWRQTMTGWTRFWPRWKARKDGENDEQDDTEHGRRAVHRGAEKVCGVAGGGLPRAHRREADPKVDARTGRMDHAGVHQRGQARR